MMIDRACISLNARCNLRCVYCHFAEKKNNSNSMLNEFSSDEIKLFSTNLKDYIVKNHIQSFKLGIVGSGEPLLSFKQLKTLVEYFYNSEIKNVMKMYVISNGTLLNDEIIDFFYFYKDIIELNISLDGDPEINKKLRGSYPDFEIYKKKFGVTPKINAVVTKEIINNQDRIFDFFVTSGFDRINFSKVFATNNPNVAINNKEYESFLIKAKSLGITSRQNTISEKYDCAKYGRLCGVGKNNIFITKTGIYPCGRFMDKKEYIIGDWNESIFDIEKKMERFEPCPKGECFYEFNKVGI
mgnify:CR=1 FL=1